MKKLYGFGDFHFGDMYPWQLDVGEHMLAWVDSLDVGSQQDAEAILAGDVFDNALNAGSCVAQIKKLADILSKKFRFIYILTGNHDRKKHKGKIQNSLEFLNSWSNIRVIENPEVVVTENGFTCLLMPYTVDEGQGFVSDTYDKWAATVKHKNIDVIAGHWTKKNSDVPFSGGDFVDLDKYPKPVTYFLGHIHTRLDEDYLGSIWATKITESNTDYPRAVKVLDSDRRVTEIPVPEFVKYKAIRYPEKITDPDDGLIYIYTVENFNNLQAAKVFYKGYNIKAVSKGTDFTKADSVESSDEDLISYTDMKKAFDDMIRESDIKVSRKLYKLVTNLLDNN